MAVFLLSGLWHGANLTFVAWGAYHAALFVPLILMGRNRMHMDTVATGRMLPSAGELASMLLTFLLVTVGWVIFRADNIHVACGYIRGMFSDLSYTPVPVGKLLLLWIALMFVVEWTLRHGAHPFDIPCCGAFRHRSVRWAAYLAVAILCAVFYGEQADFIYFQF